VPILRVVRLSLLLVAVAQPGFAQSPPAQTDEDVRFERGTLEFSVAGGLSLPVSLFRANADHQIALASLSFGRVMAGRAGRGNLELLVEVSPFLQIRQPDRVRGWSIAPLFIRWNFPPAGRVRLFGEVSGSLLWTEAPVPVRTTTFNFLDQAGFGVRISENRRRAWLVGYRFQHISNAGRVRPNPGANFNLVYLGLSFLR
jgi:Lipid A 3-O-deacylase (PagL)